MTKTIIDMGGGDRLSRAVSAFIRGWMAREVERIPPDARPIVWLAAAIEASRGRVYRLLEACGITPPNRVPWR